MSNDLTESNLPTDNMYVETVIFKNQKQWDDDVRNKLLSGFLFIWQDGKPVQFDKNTVGLTFVKDNRQRNMPTINPKPEPVVNVETPVEVAKDDNNIIDLGKLT